MNWNASVLNYRAPRKTEIKDNKFFWSSPACPNQRHVYTQELSVCLQQQSETCNVLACTASSKSAIHAIHL